MINIQETANDVITDLTPFSKGVVDKQLKSKVWPIQKDWILIK